MKDVRNANTECKYFGYYFRLVLLFFLLAHGPVADFAETEKSIFLSAMIFIWSLNPKKAVQEAYFVWGEFCISTSPAPRCLYELHERRGHGQSMLCSMTGAHEMGRRNLSLPRQGIGSARSFWGHRWRFKPTECIMSCQVLIPFPHTLQHWKHSGRVWQLETFWKSVQWWSSDNCCLFYKGC